MPYFPPVQALADFSTTACNELLARAAGGAIDDLAIHRVAPWTMHAQVATRCVTVLRLVCELWTHLDPLSCFTRAVVLHSILAERGHPLHDRQG